ncbi:MAG: hypothetical protein A3J10_02205 [Candidatus Sungbacteria bacterium RIFCSPLOWO2_02_FULL_54_10]|uniref:Nudix hydrolase domain-containing protein n=1 Tax=Candidatus Sungbacteria bacterium RIFCSPHIGHO2_02_FULL_53_17 TaxID=1802275 RepID=A0A1G2KX52_9BACT|nr:MAG: hypothetical protein A3C92_03735 [Candidatus Sungbacteria bacterium RIFCSPHIGHO2_02_FULL_53_17]OHA14043.1 MAG: hypothetical protein A3J10_02205 [Candidatus Sungbacteria bacterium RIFCSPLOWO2_02_FULL_54_10]
MEYPVRVVATGLFLEKDIEVVRETAEPLSSAIGALVNELWDVELVQNPNLFSGPMLVAQGLSISGSSLRLTCVESEYKNFMGTTHESVAALLPGDRQHRAVGFMAVTVTCDGFCILGVRSPRIDWPTLRHVAPAGRLTPRQKHPYQGIRDEFQSELGMTEADVSSLLCIGVAADLTWRRLNYEFVFLAHTALSFREVIGKARSARSGDEHSQLEPFVWDPYTIRELLLVEPEAYVPTGFAGLAMCLRYVFGTDAFPDWEPSHRTYAEHMGRRLLK